jgi:signal transduction histidine kinase
MIRLFHQTAVKRLNPGLYGKLALTFLLVLTLLAAVYGFLTAYSANRYFEANYQRLNRDVAAHIAKFTLPFINQQVNRAGADTIFFNAMVTNPSAEVYLLDSTGAILLYHAPPKEIKLNRVSLQPIHDYIQTQGQVYILGDDPKCPQEKKIFSAAKVIKNGRMQGYVYVILTGEGYRSTMSLLLQSHVLTWGIRTMLITLLAALSIGLLMFYRLTRNLNVIIQTVKQFREGDFLARIHVRSSSELTELAATFNDMADTLSHNIDDLKNAEQLRRDLIANVSHDLRTPVTAIHGYAETLALNPSRPVEQTQSYVNIILVSTQKLMKLVEELFELSKLEAQQTQPHREPFALAELVAETVTKFELIAQQKEIGLTCDDCRSQVLCLADIGMIERVLQNLVENAIKFTPDGAFVRLTMTVNPTTVAVSVTNSILGSPLSDPILRYLEKVKTTGESAANRPSGVGLGLTIVTKILNLHQTKLHIEIITDTSICFWFELPVYHPNLLETNL